MNWTLNEIAPAVPELYLLTMACVVLVVDLFLKDDQRALTYALAQGALVGLILLTLSAPMGGPVELFSGHFIRDSLGDALKVAIYAAVLLVFLYARQYLAARDLFKGEFYTLGLFAVLGMMVMVSAQSLLTLYLGLELLSLSLYAMVAMDRDNGVASEAAMKYFVLGALASGMLLYGMSMLYGAAGSLDIFAIASYAHATGSDDLMLVFGLVFVVVGLGFKLGAVPFHMWIPDVYHGAPTAMTAFIGSAPKIAGFALAIRLLADGLSGVHADWQQMLTIMAILSMAIGNVVAIAQTNIKRMLAYSTIAHVGFILLGLLAGTPEGYSAAMFYTLTYAFMALGAFGVVILLSRRGFEADRLEDFRGLNDRSPWFAFVMLLLMFSMAGVPPTAGFYAKLAVLRAVVDVDMVWLAAVAVTFSIIGVFYYLRVVKLMYFDRLEGDAAAIEADSSFRWALSANGLAMLVLGIFPGLLMGVCTAVFTG